MNYHPYTHEVQNEIVLLIVRQMHHRRDIRVDGSSEEVFVLFAEGEPMCNAGVSILLFLYQKLIIL